MEQWNSCFESFEPLGLSMYFGRITKFFACMIASLSCLLASPTYAKISAQQIYEQPDDHDLNLEYAKQQIIKGEMLDAGSALERMLYANPNWHSARLLYAAVLYRLDDQQAALRELSLLEGKDLNAEQLAKLENYKSAFQIPPRPIEAGVTSRVSADLDQGTSFRSPDRIQGYASLHLRTDRNAGNALTDANIALRDESDVSAVIKGGVRAFLPVSDIWTLRGEVNGQARRHETFSDVDYEVFHGGVGATVAKGKSVIAVDLDTQQINLSGESYLTQIGPRLTMSREVSENTYANFSLSAYDQDYDNIENAILEDERDGTKLTFQAGVLHKIDKRNKIRLAVAYEAKSAELREFAYEGVVFKAAYDHDFDANYYFKAQGKARFLDYKRSPSENLDREDSRLSGRLGIGKKIDVDQEALKSAAIEVGLNFTRRDSNLPANEFDNLGLDVRLTAGF